MLARIAHELCRRIEAHRLAVEDRGAKNLGVVAFDPCRDIDEERKACRMALGEAIFAEAIDLAEAALGKIAGIAAPRHAPDEFLTVKMNGSIVAEGCHRAPESVRFGGCEAGG